MGVPASVAKVVVSRMMRPALCSGYYLQKINDLLRRCGAFPIALLGRGFELCQYRLGIDLLGLRLSGGRGFFGRGSGGCTGCQAKGHDQYKNERQDFFHSFVFLSFVVFL